MPLYGAVVVGPPGAGKSTFCAGLCRYLSLAERPCALINLDPACEGDGLTKFAIDVRDFVSVDAVMQQQKLGPNGALRYCLEQLWKSNWLKDQIDALEEDDCFPYVVFDCPGQTELYVHDFSLRGILDDIRREFDARFTAAHLVDVAQCAVPTSYVAACLLSLTAMLRLELPHINILTKMDMANRYDLAMPLEFFREAQELHRIAPFCGVQPCSLEDDVVDEEPSAYARQLQKLSGKICELVDDFSLVCYEPLDVSDGESVAKVVRLLDKCNGHPCGVHAPQSLINDATELFLLHRGGTDGPSINVDGDNRGAAGRDREPRRAPRTVRTHAPGAPPPDVGQRGPGSFSWYASS